MVPTRPEFAPDPAMSREEMEALQRDIAAAATFEDDFAFDPDAIGIDSSILTSASEGNAHGRQTAIDDLGPGGDSASESVATDDRADGPTVVGIDQAFVDDLAVSGIVALRGGEVVERVHAVEPVSIPYVPGLLSFREGGPIVAAFESLTVDPDLALFDGSGRIHFRQAGLATHMGVLFDLPSVGVAKRLLCGRPVEPVDALPAGARVAIEADERVEAVAGTHIGYALQTRQFPDSRRVNPVYVSPGHRVSEETAADLVLALAADYKLPEPTRVADKYVAAVKAGLDVTDRTDGSRD